MSKRTIDLSETSVKAALKIMMAESGIESLADVARSIGINETTFRSAINNDAMRVKDFLKAAQSMRYTVLIESKK